MTGTEAKKRITDAGYTLADVANTLNLTPQTLQSRLNSKDLKLEFLRDVAKAINKNLYYFLEDEDLPAYQNAKNFALVTDQKIHEQSIPLYNIEASAGLVPLFKGGSEYVIDYINIPNLPNCDGAVYVRGDSMYPLLKSGDIVLYKQINDIKNNLFWGEMYLISLDMENTEYINVKFIQKSDKGDEWIKLVSQNQHHAPVDIHLNRVRAMAMIKASVRMNAMQ
jgi:phage repressor protein C with HTH and peptisase S24 domain